MAIEIANTEWPKWQEEMSPDPGLPSKVLTKPRPGHADLAGMQKYGFDDARDVLERASARETAARVAAGCLAKALLARLGVSVLSHVVGLGPVQAEAAARPGPGDLDRVDDSPVRCFDPEVEARMVDGHQGGGQGRGLARRGGGGPRLRRPGGARQPRALGPPSRRPAGPGAHEHPGREARRDRRGLRGRRRDGDRRPTTPSPGTRSSGTYQRETDRAGGIEGGMSTGGLIAARVGMKPLATLNRPVLGTVDVVTKESTVSFKERTDVTAVPAMGVVAETMMALVLASEALRKFGGDSLAEVVRNRDGYLASLHDTPSSAAAAGRG